MNLSLLCGHSYCRDCPERCSDQPEESTWLAADFKPEQEESSSSRTNLEKIKWKAVFLLPDARMPGNVQYDVCTVRKQRAFKSCLVCLCSLLSDLSLNRFPCALYETVLFTACQKSLFLTQLRPGDFLSHWSDVHLPSVLHTCLENRLSLFGCELTRWQKHCSEMFSYTLQTSFTKRNITAFIHAASLPVQMDLGHVHQESEHHPPERDTKLSDYIIDRNIFIFRPIISGWKLLILSNWVGSQLGSQNINPWSQISCN